MRTIYIHTLDGQPAAFYEGQGICFTNYYGKAAPACTSLKEIRQQQAEDRRLNGELRVWAGCRDFSWDEAVEHWGKSHRLHEESTRIIEFLRTQVEARDPAQEQAA